MQLTIDRKTLVRSINLTEKASSDKSTLPILLNTLLTAKDGRLVITTTNLEVSLTVSAYAQITENGAITVPTKLFKAVIEKLIDDNVTLRLDQRTQTLYVQSGRAKIQVKGLDAAEFPLVPTLDTFRQQDAALPQVHLPATSIAPIISQVAFSVSKDKARPLLTAIYTSLHGDELLLATTDGYRLSQRRVKILRTEDTAATCLIPAESMGHLARAGTILESSKLIDSDSGALLAFSPNQFLARITCSAGKEIEYVEMVSQLIDGRFPDYLAIIPKTHTIRAIFATDQFKATNKMAMLFAVENANIVRFDFRPHDAPDEPNSIFISATSAEMGEARVPIAAEVEGTPLEIAFNGEYLQEMLDVIPGDRLVFEGTQHTRPAVVYSQDALTQDELLYVLMPMHPPR
jgi:DNA polymerase-3 subunit beta